MFICIVNFECSLIICLASGYILPVMSARALSLGKRRNFLSYIVLITDIALCHINTKIFAIYFFSNFITLPLFDFIKLVCFTISPSPQVCIANIFYKDGILQLQHYLHWLGSYIWLKCCNCLLSFVCP